MLMAVLQVKRRRAIAEEAKTDARSMTLGPSA
jgi:hypothetical protein